MHLRQHLTRPFTWILGAIGTFLIYQIAHRYPEAVEQLYSRGLFQVIRCTIDWTIGLLPFPAFYLFWGGVVVYWVYAVWRRPRLLTVWQRIAFWPLKIVGFAAMLLVLFFWMWGFNYARVPLKDHLGLTLEPLDSTVIWRALATETHCLDSIRQMIVGADTTAISDERYWPALEEDTIRCAVEAWLTAQNYPVPGRVRACMIWPEGALFKFGTSGIYWPFIGQGNIEAGLHPLRKLSVMAHEMSHGYGFTDEGVCNFIAFVACCDHQNAYIAYSAHLDYWRTLASNCRKNNPTQYDRDFRPFVPAGIRQDERAIYRQQNKFNELAPKVRYQVYDAYLKSNGIASGMLNYDEVLMLVQAWKRKMGE